MPAHSQRKQPRLLKRFFLWIGISVLFVSFTGGFNFACSNGEQTNSEPFISDKLVAPPDCYCIAPGTACSTDADCKSPVKNCMPLLCSRGYCERKKEEDPPELPPDDGGPEPYPNCPLTCKKDSDCNPLYCGQRDWCDKGECKDPGITRP